MNIENKVLGASQRRLLALAKSISALSVDAYSASPALRLRYRMLAAKTSVRPPLAFLPPAVGEPPHDHHACFDRLMVARAARDRHPLAKLMRLRAEAAERVEQLLTFLDETEGVVDDEECGDEQDGDLAGSASDLEEDRSDHEPSLGWTAGVAQGQGRWGDTQDIEAA